MTGEERTLFTYEFIPNIDNYEPTLFLGLTIYELGGVAGAFLLPMMAIQSVIGLLLGVICAIAAFALLKRFERLGNLSFPVYLFKRTMNSFTNAQVTLAHLHPNIVAEVKVSDFEGQHLATYGQNGSGAH